MSLIKIKTKNKSKINIKEKFERVKRKVQKYYPNAKTSMDLFKKFFVVDGNGYRIIPDDFKIENQKTVFEAWKTTWMFIVRDNIVRTNTEKFNKTSTSDSLITKMYNQD